MNVTLQELLHAINILGEDRDVTVDGIDSIAVCPPVKITPCGREFFKQALTANVIVEYQNDSHQATYVSDADEKIDEMAWDLLSSLAGYCYADGYDQWFEGDDAELVLLQNPMTMTATHVFRDSLGYTFVVTECNDGTAKWRKTVYKSIAHARRAINRWAEGHIEKIK